MGWAMSQANDENETAFDLPVLGRDGILAQTQLPLEKVQVPEWKGSVFIRTMTAGERDTFEQKVFEENKAGKNVNVRARLCSLCLVNEKGERLFSDLDALLLAKKSSRAIERIVNEIQKLNGLGKEDIKALEKNSETDPSAESS